jgi:hypothetical protein
VVGGDKAPRHTFHILLVEKEFGLTIVDLARRPDSTVTSAVAGRVSPLRVMSIVARFVTLKLWRNYKLLHLRPVVFGA